MAASDMVHANLKGLIVGGYTPTHIHINTQTHTRILDTDIHILVFNRTTQCIKHASRKGISSEPLQTHTHTHIFLDTWGSILVCIKHGKRQQEQGT